MTKDPKIFLKHILESVEFIESYLGNSSKSVFYKDTRLQDAIIRRLEVIGEASKSLPTGFKDKNSNINWRSIAGMRDKLTHHYFGINLERVWLVLKEDLPKLKKDIKEILEKESAAL